MRGKRRHAGGGASKSNNQSNGIIAQSPTTPQGAQRPPKTPGRSRRSKRGKPTGIAQLLDEIVTLLRRHMVLPEGAADAIALWVSHTHAFDGAQISPRLLIRSAEKQSGKTNLMLILHHLVRKPHPVSNITGPGIFRTIAATLLMDEADAYVAKNDDIASILNSGHNRAMAIVTRCVGKDHEPTDFTTWSPVAIAGIGRQRDTLEDRSIIIPLRRRLRSEQVDRLRLDRMSDFTAVRDKLEKWGNAYVIALGKRNDPQVPDELPDRAADNWRPLFGIADFAGGGWPDRARRASRLLTPSSAEDDSAGTQLLADIRIVFAARKLDRISSQELTDALAKMEDRPWGEWNKGRSITPYQVSKRLKSFDIAPRVIRIGGRTPHGYLVGWFDDAFARYLPAEAATPQHEHDFNALDAHGSATETATRGPEHATSGDPVAAGTEPVAADVAPRPAENTRVINGVAAVAGPVGDQAKPNGSEAGGAGDAAKREPVFDPETVLNAEQE